MKPSSRPFRGPYVALTLAEIARVRDALCGHPDDLACAIRAKCDAALSADKRLREPTA